MTKKTIHVCIKTDSGQIDTYLPSKRSVDRLLRGQLERLRCDLIEAGGYGSVRVDGVIVWRVR